MQAAARAGVGGEGSVAELGSTQSETVSVSFAEIRILVCIDCQFVP
jgi:hypothetical protein